MLTLTPALTLPLPLTLTLTLILTPTLTTPQDARHAAELVRVLREAKQHVPAELVQLGQAAKGPKKAAGAQEHEPSPWGIPTLG